MELEKHAQGMSADSYYRSTPVTALERTENAFTESQNVQGWKAPLWVI